MKPWQKKLKKIEKKLPGFTKTIESLPTKRGPKSRAIEKLAKKLSSIPQDNPSIPRRKINKTRMKNQMQKLRNLKYKQNLIQIKKISSEAMKMRNKPNPMQSFKQHRLNFEAMKKLRELQYQMQTPEYEIIIDPMNSNRRILKKRFNSVREKWQM